MRLVFGLVGACALVCATVAQASEKYPEPLPDELVPAVETLPPDYPDDFIFVHDFNFNSPVDGRISVIDISTELRSLKGVMNAGLFANFRANKKRGELYVVETFYSRIDRGTRTDVLTIYDPATLTPKGEVVLPDGKRMQSMPTNAHLSFTNDDKWALVANFTPASSVYIVDLEARKVLNEVDMPGCVLTIPTGKRGFSSMCADGTMATIALDKMGKVDKQRSGESFNDLDDNPYYMVSAEVGDVHHFVTFDGQVRSIDFSSRKPKLKKPWSILQKGDDPSWRPGGWQIIAADSIGHIYVLVHPDGKEGSHKDGGTEVWVYNTKSKKRTQRIALKNHGYSIEVTGGDAPRLVVATPDSLLDVYDARSGAHERTLGSAIVYTPLMMHKVPQ